MNVRLTECGNVRLTECGEEGMNSHARDVRVWAVSAVLLLWAWSSTGAGVRAWEGTITIPTYGWAEDVNPKFWALEDQVKFSTTVKGAIVYQDQVKFSTTVKGAIVYPYTMQDHLYRTKEDRTYKVSYEGGPDLQGAVPGERIPQGYVSAGTGGPASLGSGQDHGRRDVPPQQRHQAEHDRDARGLYQRRGGVEPARRCTR